jgi:RNA polymerase sigma factor (sigma-70 family)
MAEDVLQEAFVSAFQNLRSFQGKSSFGAWLKRIVVNKAISYLRKTSLRW